MTKKMLAVALMAGSVLVLAGCNNTPAEEPVDEVVTGEELVVEPVEEVVVEDEVVPTEELTGEEVVEPVVVEQPVEVVAE